MTDLSTAMSRPLGATDAALVAALHAACVAESWSATAVATLLEGPGVWGLLLYAAPAEEPEPIGFCLARSAADEAEILMLCVLPGQRRRGLGRRLLQAAMLRAHAQGAARLFLEVAEDNTAGRALYDAAGFATVGRRPGYYQRASKASIAAAVMCLDLTTYTLTQESE